MAKHFAINMLSDSDFIMLNAIYLKKMATPQTISEVTALPRDVIDQCLAAAEASGWVMNLPTGVMLITEGIDEVLAYYRQAYTAVRADVAVTKWYANFEVLLRNTS